MSDLKIITLTKEQNDAVLTAGDAPELLFMSCYYADYEDAKAGSYKHRLTDTEIQWLVDRGIMTAEKETEPEPDTPVLYGAGYGRPKNTL